MMQSPVVQEVAGCFTILSGFEKASIFSYFATNTSSFDILPITLSQINYGAFQRTKIKIIEWWFETKCYTAVCCCYAQEFNVRYVEALQQKFIQYMVQKFMAKGTVLDCRKEKAGAPITARSLANVDRVCASVQQSPKKSLRHWSQELGISVTSFQQMLRKDLTKFPYKISTCHKLTDKQRCTEMCNRVAEQMDCFQNWIDRVWFTDETHFHLNVAVIHHNNRYWEDERPEEIDKRCLKSPKVTALCALNAKKGMLGPYWLEDSRRRTVIVNGECYREVLNRINEGLNQLNTPNQKRLLWFQQEGATPHTAHGTMAHLRTLFGNRIWSLQVVLELSLHSPDLAPLDFSFWGAAKAQVYKEKPCFLRQLKQAVESFTQSIIIDTCCRVIENFAVCIKVCAN